ncbi:MULTISPECIES: zincin-like metallopeptidase domain-containing protein [unclassified Mesorhizobium]|uniref:ArdC family protein n=1 Tax=unclassified Mesorhizobium TaxID=325217 RepID=UPI00241699E5|nr:MULTISPECIES: zincin-like metallopeptidase domain-containing protein [unclassified Mesorhizobium]WFP65635.1 zincin-like metallopeptidase domain-containing protein [Mesorhizobium sp. WSM4904]WFP79328.1 zincin-like metallopeptidase domain-containing protein [Mesorhizobium sp. WSM4906]
MRKTGKRGARGEVGAKQGEPLKRTLYSEITDRIIADLERGSVPWVKPWGRAKAALGLPKNAATGRSYSGINILILWGAVIERSYPGQNWLTFRQALSLGGNVRKGEHGTTIVHADRFIPKNEKERAKAEDTEPHAVPFLKRFTVFNVAQCDSLPEHLYSNAEPLPEREIVPKAEALMRASGADIRIGGDRAFYLPAGDFVQLPPQPAFFEPVNYYRTALHELGHWTGHPTRLARDLSGSFGSKAYAREELVAELTAAFTCSSLGIEPTVRHADYIGSWLTVLREDNRAIFRAASLASKAADFLLAFQADERSGAQEGMAA